MSVKFTSTVEFENRAEALEWLEIGRFRRLPVKGPIERWAANETGDGGETLITFASSAGRDEHQNAIAFQLNTTEVGGRDGHHHPHCPQHHIQSRS